MMNPTLFYKEKPIESLSREELIEALEESYRLLLEKQKSFIELYEVSLLKYK
jgi:hypothetical protein